MSSNFTGSSTPADYVFDIDLPPEMHPPDIQAYLLCVPTPTQEAMDACPCFPWIHGLTFAQADVATSKLREDLDPIVDPSADRMQVHCNFMVLTNARVPLPPGSIGPQHPLWVELIAYLYANHPVLLRTSRWARVVRRLDKQFRRGSEGHELGP
ncbi:hypothetical protein A1Q1_05595 [Trichosporon asahii var. asahii CBS 2479]|uniref:Uncharacterized protein n=1 Tax=Trichosporon asahii var. asahii (strain ATCC 90039 / CBS 2479 / JCM 2466 / KCTC 7840 / NBRC 103889/ NCYC 2677 / UAMH 7654) TaxID=1186058 RepID=J5Q7R2_TRIAS|nr:hypothetical protein A1Q1_05595 [Trichosporon asahii var. asahii CBS 2479]EJT45923.1 hypothetical protein A1Q1_05595 [Trichosporon asahii var. asahii CBS 2479]